ncbi:MAG: hypothetical protein ACJ766_16575, partial [Thermoleophilaceae bacterium]
MGLLIATTAVAPTASAGIPGVEHLKYRAGPFHINPGQNRIAFAPLTEKPPEDGYITSIKANLRRKSDNSIPRVDVLHLHHGVWFSFRWGIFFASGEEKTTMRLPPGYGLPYKASDVWILNHMIHNLLRKPDDVYLTYDLGFIPASSPAAAHIRSVRPIWTDVESGHIYPVFNVPLRSGPGGRFTFPNDARDPYKGGRRLNQTPITHDGVLVATAGHVHPGGLHTDLYLKRTGARVPGAHCSRLHSRRARRRCRAKAPRGRGDEVHLFRSNAHYYEPAGPVSWDMSMTATRRNWRVKVKRGDVLRTTATYNTIRGAWFESMGIMLVYEADSGPGHNPFKTRVDLPGRVTHGHLRENNNHGGKRTALPDATRERSGVSDPSVVSISDFRFRFGDLRRSGVAGRPPMIRRGHSLLFVNGDDSKGIYHSISACRAPCNRSTGIAYPVENGRVAFDSGQLGDRLPATGRRRWRTPRKLPPGTYTYFCRIHPFMRGAFRVE